MEEVKSHSVFTCPSDVVPSSCLFPESPAHVEDSTLSVADFQGLEIALGRLQDWRLQGEIALGYVIVMGRREWYTSP